MIPRSHPLALVYSLALVAFTLVVGAWPAAAQHEGPPRSTAGAMTVLRAADYEANTYVPPPSPLWDGGPEEARGGRAPARTVAPTAEIIVYFDRDMPAAARKAFRFAADVWEAFIDSAVPIQIVAEWDELETGVLGAAGPGTFYTDFVEDATVFDDTWYPVALAEALAGENLNGDEADIFARFNSAFGWDFGIGGESVGRYNFATVVLHEIGHGLGFVGSFDVVTEGEGSVIIDPCPPAFGDDPTSQGDVPLGYGCWGLQAGGADPLILPVIFDRFTEDASGTALLNTDVYPNPSAVLGDVLQSDAVFFDGPTVSRVSREVPIDLYAPSNFEPGSSFSHLNEVRCLERDADGACVAACVTGNAGTCVRETETLSLAPGGANSLMTPQLARSEVIFTPGPFTCAIFADTGWPLGPGCRAVLNSSVSDLVAEVEEGGTVTFRFQLGAESGFTSVRAVQDVEAGDGVTLEPVGPIVPVAPDDAGAYAVRVGPLAPGLYAFRLRFERPDRSVFLSEPLAVAVRPNEALAVFPNPFTDAAAVVVDVAALAEDADEVEVVVYDAVGQRVAVLYEGTPSAPVLELTLPGRGLASGVYFVHAVAGDAEATQAVTHVE